MTLQLHDFISDTQPDLEIIKIDADNTTYTGTILDMLGYEGVVFLAAALRGEVATYGLKAQTGAASNLSDTADLEGTNVAFATAIGTDGFAFLEVKRPVERYIRAALVVANLTTPNAVCVIAVRYGKNVVPETNADGEVHAGPAEGTA